MGLYAGINQYLTDELLTQLAGASALPLAATRATAAVAVPGLVRALAQPTDLDELNARWDMCRQLYLSQLLTEPDELLRTDLGWPDRRRYLSQKMLGTKQLLALADATGQPAQAGTLLGYLTIIALALVGEHANHADLAPQSLGNWLAGQQAPEVSLAPPAAVLASMTATPPARVAATAGKAKLTALSVGGGVAIAGLVGGYFLLGSPVGATRSATPTEVVATAAPAVAEPAAAPAAPETTPDSAAAPAAPVAVAIPAKAAAQPVRATSKPIAAAAKPLVGLRDTVGNAGLARQVGGRFNVATGRYLKGEGQPLIIKLVNRATLTVGINSTESLLYKRLVNPTLPQPTDIAIDRLSFDLGQARLGAEGAQQLGSVASLLKTFPKARLIVVGHANAHEAQAMRLGLQRANLAVEELVKQGIAADRLQAQGMLSAELPGDSDSAEKQARLQGITLKISRL